MNARPLQAAIRAPGPTAEPHDDAAPETLDAGLQRLRAQQAKLEAQFQALMKSWHEHREATNDFLRQRSTDPSPPSPRTVPAGRDVADVTGDGYRDALHRGEARRVAWTRDGTLVPAAALAGAWGRSRQALDQACARHELFNLKIGNRRWYPAVFLHHDAQAVAAVCQALGAGDPASMLVFWLRPHGGLDGRTVSEALGQRPGLDRVIELARAWALEHGWPHAAVA